jgi:hypothetical protein
MIGLLAAVHETQRWGCHKTTAILQSQPHLMLLASEGREW